MTLSVLLVSEDGMGVPAIVGDATGGNVRRRWRVPIRIDSNLLLLRPGRCDRTSCANQAGSQRDVSVSDNCVSSAYVANPRRRLNAPFGAGTR